MICTRKKSKNCTNTQNSNSLAKNPMSNTETISDAIITKSKLSQRIPTLFYFKPCTELAESLLGKCLVRRLQNGELLKGKIVETESYLGVVDKASHSYKGKVTERNLPMFMKPGTSYVYIIYGMYFCFNISSFEEGSAVLIRALEPLQGMSTMQMNRKSKKKSDPKKELKLHQLCNGPSKLCQAFQITKTELNKTDLPVSELLWLEDAHDVAGISDVVKCKRIGINSSAGEWANRKLRFYVRGSKFVSVRDREAEKVSSGNEISTN